MNHLTLISEPGNKEDMLPESIIVTDRANGSNLAQIYCDGVIVPNPDKNQFSEAFDTFVLIANNFYLFYNNIKTQ